MTLNVEKNDPFKAKDYHKFETYYKIASIFEEIKKKRIELNFIPSTKVKLKKTSEKFVITLGVTNNGVTATTRLERTLGNIIFNSPNELFIKKIKERLPNTNTEHIEEIIQNATIIFETLEQRRVETCYGAIYPGANDRFIEAREIESKVELGNIKIPEDPIMALKMAKYGLNDLVEQSEFKEAIKFINAVEQTGKFGAYKLSLIYWEKVVEPWLLYNSTNIEIIAENDSDSTYEVNKKEKTPNKYTKEFLKSFIKLSLELQNTDDDAAKEQINEMLEKIRDEAKKSEQIKTGHAVENSSLDRELMRYKLNHEENEDVINEKNKEFSSFEKKEIPKVDFTSDKNFETICNDLKIQGGKEIERIEKELAKITSKASVQNYKWTDMIEKIELVKRKDCEPVKYNKNTAIGLKNIFKKIRGGEYTDIDSHGSEIDIDSYINFKITHQGEFMKGAKTFGGFDIIIAIDESGSMRNNVEMVRRMCATLFEAVTDLPNVRITILGWYGQGKHCNIHKIIKSDQIGQITADGSTPLAFAVWYAKHEIEKMHSKRRLFFLITDGSPDNPKDIQSTKEAIKIMTRKGVSCNGIYAGETNLYSKKNMNEIFGKNYTECKNFNQVDSIITLKLSKQIIRTLKSSH